MILNEVLDLKLHTNQQYGDGGNGRNIHLTIFFNPDDKENMVKGEYESEENFQAKRKNYGADDLDFDYEGLTKPVTDRVNDMMAYQAQIDAENGVKVDNNGNIYDYEGNPLGATAQAPEMPNGYREQPEGLNQEEQNYAKFREEFVARAAEVKNSLDGAIQQSEQFKGSLGLSAYTLLLNKWFDGLKKSGNEYDGIIANAVSGALSNAIEIAQSVVDNQKTLNDPYSFNSYGKDIERKKEVENNVQTGTTAFDKALSSVEALFEDPAESMIPDSMVPTVEKTVKTNVQTFINKNTHSKIQSKFKYEKHPNRLEWTIHLGLQNGNLTRLWSSYVLKRLVPIAFYHMQMIANSNAVKKLSGETASDATMRFAGELGQAFYEKFSIAKDCADMADGLTAKDVLNDMQMNGETVSRIDRSQIIKTINNIKTMQQTLRGIYDKYQNAYKEAQESGDMNVIRSMMKDRITSATNIYSELNQAMMEAQGVGGAAEVKSKTQWAKEGKSVKPGEMPIGLLVPMSTHELSPEDMKKFDADIDSKYKTNLAKSSQPIANAGSQYQEKNLQMDTAHRYRTKSHLNGVVNWKGGYAIKFAYYTDEQVTDMYDGNSIFSGMRNTDGVYMDGDKPMVNKDGSHVEPKGADYAGKASEIKKKSELKIYNQKRLNGFKEWCESRNYDDLYESALKRHKSNPVEAMRVILFNIIKNELESEYGDNVKAILGAEPNKYIKRQSYELTDTIMDAIGYDNLAPLNDNMQLFPPSASKKDFEKHVNGVGRFNTDISKNREEAVWDAMHTVGKLTYSTLSDYLAQHIGKRENKFGKKPKNESLYSGLFDGQEMINESFELPSVDEVLRKYEYVPERSISECRNIIKVRDLFNEQMSKFK